MAHRSSLRLVTLFAAMVLGLILLARAFLTPDGAAGEIENDPAPSVSQPADAAASAPATALVSPKSEAPASAAVAASPTETQGERSAAATLDELDLADAVWVSGTVHFPEHTPLGEVVEVIANGKKFKNREMHRARVHPDGSFRVAFAKDTRTGRLAIDAAHLFLPKPLVVKPADVASGLVLEPELGGHILGVVIPPVGVADAAKQLEGATMSLFGWDPARRSDPVNSSAKLDKDLRFEFRGVPLLSHTSVNCQSKFWLPDGGEVGLVAGVDTPLELRLCRGVLLAGKVLDADGAPVSGASLELRTARNGGSSNSFGEMVDPKDGSFELSGKEPGKITLTAQKKGFLDATLELGQLKDGDVSDALELRLQSGASISGRVVWPDGSPAEMAMVSATLPVKENGEWREPRDLQFFAAADGSFKITGLAAGSFVVTASGTPRHEQAPEDAVGEPEEAAKKPAKKSIARAPKWTAKQEDVPNGSDSLVLVLQSGYALSGRVVDEVGAPVDRFQIVATPKGAEDESRTALPKTVIGSFRDDGGSFLLEGLHPGAWNVLVKAKGFTFSEEGLAVEVPDRLALGSLVVTHAAALRGQVLAPDGTPIAGAQVEIEMPDADPMFWRGGTRNGKDVRSDAKGRFEFKSAPSGEYTLRATRDGFAGSDALALNVTPGQTLENLTLSLRRGGRLEVLLGSSAGSKISGRQLTLYGQFRDAEWRQATTDASGHATLEGLTSGEWQVNLQPSDDELAAQGSGEGEKDWMLRDSLTQQARVTIVDGETAHVILGAPPKAAVEVSGVVRSGGSPMAGAAVQAHFRGESSGGNTKFARCDAQGAYKLTLHQPGSYSIAASRDGMNPSIWKSVTVPDAPRFVLDIDLPNGSIAGRVLGPDGRGLASAWVSIELEKPQLSSEPVSGYASTDDSGAFRLENLPAGIYKLTANGQGSHSTDGASELGSESVHGLSLPEGGALRDVELRLALGGSLQGTVRGPDGQPVADAMVYLLDASGAWVDATGSDDKGRYECRGIRAGNFTVSAMQENQLSEPAEVRIVVGQKTKLDLKLRDGAQLVVEVQDRDGTPVGASISVKDSRGRDQTLLRNEASADKASRTVGPLAAGDYTVTATNHDGGEASATVHVSGEETKTVQLKFGG
ncbi:MAG: carboxypeptidase regulatory-like domain-containing protein [Planctomycetota bacterium]